MSLDVAQKSIATKNNSFHRIKGLAGATYEITAVEDVITLDGTVRYTKGQVVATITTGTDRTATTVPLYLGKYSVKEITAPYGMVLNAEPVEVKLAYAGETVKVTATSTSFINERQTVVVDLSKALEKDEIFNIGNSKNIFYFAICYQNTKIRI